MIPMVNDSDLQKFITFDIENYQLALSIATVVKVTNIPPLYRTKLQSVGFLEVGGHIIRLLKLQDYLPQEHQEDGCVPSPSCCLIIVRGVQEDLWGITVDTPPNLIELPIDMLRSLPRSRSNTPFMNLMSHAAVLSEARKDTLLFLLDLTRAIETDTETVPALMAQV